MHTEFQEGSPPMDVEFAQIWNDNHVRMAEGHAALQAGRNEVQNLHSQLAPDTTLYLTDVTLRDGQQQRTRDVTTAERVQVFDEIVQTGVDRIEIGHLGNGNGDQQLAREIVKHVAAREMFDARYRDVKLQVLFGSQEHLIKEGIGVLEEAFQEQYGDEWQARMADKVVVHVYDRADQNLINTASNPYSPQESARRVAAASQHAIDAGFKHFSVSAEAATAISPDVAIQYYRSVNQYLANHGAETINVNLANTYGYSANAEWNTTTLAIFNAAVKHGFDNVTTSIHTHNDADNAVSFAMSAVVAGFDRVEGTINGMGERAGNVANVDVIARLVEAARHEQEQQGRRSAVAAMGASLALRRTVRLDEGVARSLELWYSAGTTVSEIFGPHAMYRWHRTSVGNPYAHDNGSGPHDQAMKAGIVNPVDNPPYRNYEWFVTVTDMLGRPTRALAIADPDAIREVTVGNHAGGGSTRAVMAGEVRRADADQVEKAKLRYDAYRDAILGRLVNGTTVIAG